VLPCLRLIDFNAQKLRVVYYFLFSQHRIDRTSEYYRSIYPYILVFRETDEIEREMADFWIMLVTTGIRFSSYYGWRVSSNVPLMEIPCMIAQLQIRPNQ
jgi:hypothetical protein